MKRIIDTKGFTLIEITIGFALLTLVMAAATSSYVGISRLQQQGVSTRAVQQAGRTIMEQMVRETRGANSLSVTGTPSVLSINTTMSGSVDNVIKYYLSGTRLTRSVCDPTAACVNSTLNGSGVRITKLTFEYFDVGNIGKPTVRIKMAIEQGDASLIGLDPYKKAYELDTTVSPRTYQ